MPRTKALTNHPLNPKEDTLEPQTPVQPNRRIAVRIATAAAALITLAHLFASFLWIAPPSPLREIPGEHLKNYMLPWYGQSWSVFAPAPINGDFDLKVRAIIVNDAGKEEASDWISAAAVEASMHAHQLFPPRAGGLAFKQASNHKGAWDELTTEQKDIAALGYYKGDDWLGRMQAEMNAAANDSNKQAVANYIVQERYTDAYATQVAQTIWGDSVRQVQYETSRQGIVAFTERNNPAAKRPAPVIVKTGWRGLITLDGQSPEAFSDVFKPAYERMDD